MSDSELDDEAQQLSFLAAAPCEKPTGLADATKGVNVKKRRVSFLKRRIDELYEAMEVTNMPRLRAGYEQKLLEYEEELPRQQEAMVSLQREAIRDFPL